ncbi:MAG: hypothetical protein J7515_03110 [Caulobacter sp.]|nr:hypothetical protein [Caulobacter sp.]
MENIGRLASDSTIVAQVTAQIWLDGRMEDLARQDPSQAARLLSDLLDVDVDLVSKALESVEANPLPAAPVRMGEIPPKTNPVPGTFNGGPSCNTAGCPADTFVPRCVTTTNCPTLTTGTCA